MKEGGGVKGEQEMGAEALCRQLYAHGYSSGTLCIKHGDSGAAVLLTLYIECRVHYSVTPGQCVLLCW